jgi:hypothetical protein
MLGTFRLPKIFYIRIDGYCSTVYKLYKVKADTREDAIQMAKEAFVKEYEVYETDYDTAACIEKEDGVKIEELGFKEPL